MSVKLIAVYSAPEDPVAFRSYYETIHTPITRAIPGLIDLRVTWMEAKLMGPGDIHMIAELVFPEQAAFDEGMASDQNKAAGRDLANFAKGKVSLFVAHD